MFNKTGFRGETWAKQVVTLTLTSHTVYQARDWPLIVRVGEKYQLLVDKIIVGEILGGLTIQVVLGKKTKTQWKPTNRQITASQAFAVILPQAGCAPCAGAC